MLLSDTGDVQWHLRLPERHRAKEPYYRGYDKLLESRIAQNFCLPSQIVGLSSQALPIINSKEHTIRCGKPPVFILNTTRGAGQEFVIDFAMSALSLPK